MSTHNLDHNRLQRIGFPEVVYGYSKNVAALRAILREYQERNENALVTKLQATKAEALWEDFPDAFYDPISGCFTLQSLENQAPTGEVAILSGGTSDEFVVNEVYYTLAFLGHPPERIHDVGVSGLHRIISRLEGLKAYKVLIIVAGFEGALPTVVGGLLPQPIISVPVSVGYGVASGGQAALHSMLGSCANGITVVNIDNGYGAAVAAYRILKGADHGK